MEQAEKAGFEVVDRTEFGTPDILRAALMAGEVDLVLDYTGSGQYYHETDSTDAWTDPVAGYELTRDLDREVNDLIWLTPANANNTEGLAVRRDFAQEHGLKTIADLAAYINAGGEIKLIAAASFVENVKGLIGFEEAYGFRLKADQLITLASGNTAEMLKALYEQRDGVNVSLVYGWTAPSKRWTWWCWKIPRASRLSICPPRCFAVSCTVSTLRSRRSSSPSSSR